MYGLEKEPRDSEWAYENCVRLYSELDNSKFARGVLRFWCESQAYYLEDLKDCDGKDHSTEYADEIMSAVMYIADGKFKEARGKLAFLAVFLYNPEFANYDEWEE